MCTLYQRTDSTLANPAVRLAVFQVSDLLQTQVDQVPCQLELRVGVAWLEELCDGETWIVREQVARQRIDGFHEPLICF